MSRSTAITDFSRGMLGFLLGIAVMWMVVSTFQVNRYDYEFFYDGVRTLLAGGNPWAGDTYVYGYYNPPHSVLFLWPLMFAGPPALAVIGGALLISMAFYRKAWVALVWFGTNSFLWIISVGGIDMYLMGAGLVLLFAGDHYYDRRFSPILRALAFGFLLIKPQGGIFIILIYIWRRRDWRAAVLAFVLYGLAFVHLIPDWLNVVISQPPTSQTVASHSLWARYGPLVAVPIAVWVATARKWRYWELGGALAAILSPYGMPGVPQFLILSSIKRLAAIPIVLVFSALLAWITWVTPPQSVEYYTYLNAFMGVYNMGMIGLLLILACYPGETTDTGWVNRLRYGLPFSKRLPPAGQPAPQSFDAPTND